MGEDIVGGAGGQGAAAAAAFDGIIKGWPEKAVQMLNVPKDKNDFILYMSCELFKNQHIENPKAQAKKSVEYANALYNELRSRGIISDE